MTTSAARARAALVGAWAAVTVAQAQPAATLLPAQSEIVFVSTQMGVPVEGSFKRFTATIALDPQQPATAKVAFDLDAKSASLGIPETDAELMKPDWFDAAKYPQASFRSTSVRAAGAGRFEVAGTLTIKSTTLSLTVPVAVTQSGSLSTASGSFTIRRTAFQIGAGAWADTSLVADEVRVRFKLVLSGLPAL